MNPGQISWLIASFGASCFILYAIGVLLTKHNIKKILTEKVETSRKNPHVVKAYQDILYEIFGDRDEVLSNSTTDKLYVQLIRDGEAYFKTDDFQTSLIRLEEAYAISRTQLQMDEALKFKSRAEAMIKFDKAKWQLEGTDVDPLKIMVLLEEAKTLAGDFVIPDYAERKAKILDKIIEKYGK